MRGRGGRGRSRACGGVTAGFPGVAGPGAADVERGAVGDEVVRRAVGDAGGDDVAGPRGHSGPVRPVGRGRVRDEVHEAVVPRSAGHAAGGGILPPFSLGHQDLDHGSVLLLVLLGRDLVDQRDEPLVPVLHHVPRHLAVHGRGGRPGADRVLEGEGGREPGLPHDLQGVGEVGLGLPREADDDVGGDGRVRQLRADVLQDRQVALATVGAAHRPQDRVRAGLQRHVQAGHHVGRLRHRRDHVLGEVARMR